MTGERPDWLIAVSENRASLERIAKHGQTGLAQDVARLLQEADRKEPQYDGTGSLELGPHTIGKQNAVPDATGVNENDTEVVEFVSWDRISGLLEG